MAIRNKSTWILLLVVAFSFIIQLTVCQNVSDSSSSNESSDEFDEYELIFAHIIYRHGDRNPMESYPNDPYKDETFWKNGFGALSNVGKREQYELGKYLRTRYQKLLGAKYSPHKIYIRSTDEDRNLMSAECNAAGMFEPIGDEVWNDENFAKWQPTPIHTIPLSDDFLLNSFVPCPRFDQMFKQRMETQEIKSLLEEHNTLINFMESHSGKSLRELVDVLNLYNILFVENRKGLELPEWAKIALKSNDTLDYLGAINYQSVSYSIEMKKLRAGFLIKEMLDRFKNKTLSLLHPDRTVWMYAAHGSVIVNVLNSLDLFDMKIPLFSSSILFELFQRDTGTAGTEHFVQITYKRTVSEHSRPLVIPGCGSSMCSLEKFLAIYKDILPEENEDYTSLCRLKFK